MPSSLHIGLDLDGTLVDYNAIFLRLALESALVPPGTRADKTLIRDFVRRNHGDAAWQGLQAQAYGKRMIEARLFDGVFDELRAWAGEQHLVSIVSHKSRYTHLLGKDGPDLHQYARQSLDAWGISDCIPPERIHFCPTREAKCQRIAQLGCHVFVDDLPEVFTDAAFPRTVRSVLFAPCEEGVSGSHILCRNWHEVSSCIAALTLH